MRPTIGVQIARDGTQNSPPPPPRFFWQLDAGVHRLEQSLDVPEQAAALASEVRSAAKSAIGEWLESPVSLGSLELVFREFAERRIGSVSTTATTGSV